VQLTVDKIFTESCSHGIGSTHSQDELIVDKGAVAP